MLADKLNELESNSLFVNFKESIVSNKYLDLFLLGTCLFSLFTLGLDNILFFTLFLFSVKTLGGLNTLVDTDKVKYLTNLVKFWCMSWLLVFLLDTFDNFIGYNLIKFGIETVLSYFLVSYTSSWFNSNMLLDTNDTKVNKVVLSGSIDFIDRFLTKLIDFYNINYISLNTCLNVIVKLFNKLNLVTVYVKNLKSYKEDKNKEDNVELEETSESSLDTTKNTDESDKLLTNDLADEILDKVLKETFEKKERLDSLDDDDFTMVSNKKLD